MDSWAVLSSVCCLFFPSVKRVTKPSVGERRLFGWNLLGASEGGGVLWQRGASCRTLINGQSCAGLRRPEESLSNLAKRAQI